jgi:hypothetical protein
MQLVILEAKSAAILRSVLDFSSRVRCLRAHTLGSESEVGTLDGEEEAFDADESDREEGLSRQVMNRPWRVY